MRVVIPSNLEEVTRDRLIQSVCASASGTMADLASGADLAPFGAAVKFEEEVGGLFGFTVMIMPAFAAE
jgi:hypothetical protein